MLHRPWSYNNIFACDGIITASPTISEVEQVTRIELASPAWKAGALTIVLHLQIFSVPLETVLPFLCNIFPHLCCRNPFRRGKNFDPLPVSFCIITAFLQLVKAFFSSGQIFFFCGTLPHCPCFPPVQTFSPGNVPLFTHAGKKS